LATVAALQDIADQTVATVILPSANRTLAPVTQAHSRFPQMVHAALVPLRSLERLAKDLHSATVVRHRDIAARRQPTAISPSVRPALEVAVMPSLFLQTGLAVPIMVARLALDLPLGSAAPPMGIVGMASITVMRIANLNSENAPVDHKTLVASWMTF
jgi:hypothetical protein